MMADQKIGALLIAFCIGLLANANPPEISFTSPLAIAAGQATQVTLHGKELLPILSAWSGFDAKFLPASSPGIQTDNGKSQRVLFDVPNGVCVGIYGVRIASAQGVSPPFLLMIDDLKTIKEQPAEHTSRHSAQEIEPPVAVEGSSAASGSDFYSFEAQAGQWISIEVVSSRLGYGFDAAITVVDEHGQEVAFADDSPGLGGDCRLRFQSHRRQRYFIELHDARFGQGERFQYRLRIGDFPLITTTFPLAASTHALADSNQPLHQHQFDFCRTSDAERPPAPLLRVDVSKSVELPFLPIALRTSAGGGSAMARYAVSSLPNAMVSRTGSHESIETAMWIKDPVAVNAVFRSQAQRHFYRMAMLADERRTIRGITRNLGSPTDLRINIYAPDGRIASSVDDSGLEEAVVNFKADTAGEYVLEMEEIQRRHGPEYSYRVEITPTREGFELFGNAGQVIIGKGGYGLLPITCQRSGYEGAVSLEVVSENCPFRIENNRIEAGQNETLLKILPVADLPVGDLQTIRIAGVGHIGSERVKQLVSIVDEVRGRLPAVAYPPGELWYDIPVSTAESFPDFYKLKFASQQVYFPRLVGENYFTVFCTDRITGFTEPIQVEALGLPNGFRVSGHERPVGNSKNNEYRFALNGPANFPLGAHTISVRGLGTYRGQTKLVQLDDITLSVVEPLIISLVQKSSDQDARQIEIMVSAQRFVARGGGDRKEILCTWKVRPSWLKCPDSFIIPAGKNEHAVRMTLANSTDPAPRVGQLVLLAETQVKDQTIKVESEPLNLVVGTR